MSALDAALEAALDRLARAERALVALDFDGVLAPIVADPDAVVPVPGAVAAVRRLVASPGVHVAYVSGRTLADLRRLADAPDGVLLVGSHGAELADPDAGRDHLQGADDAGLALLDPEQSALLRRVVDALEGISGGQEGLPVELKPAGAVLHTRRADRDVARRAGTAALEGPATWPGVHLTRGKEVVELSVLDVTKGAALRRLRHRLALPPGSGGVLYVGDDATDERAFAVLDDGRGDVTVKVGEGPTRARHRVGSPEDVAFLLARLAARREGSV